LAELQDHLAAGDTNGRWLKGQTGNAWSRQRISEKLLADLADVWQEHGVSVLQRLAVTEPGKLAQIAYGLLPRDVFISVEQRAPGNLDPEGWSTLRRLLDLIQASGAGGQHQLVWCRGAPIAEEFT
jgi:hypothetical protein